MLAFGRERARVKMNTRSNEASTSIPLTLAKRNSTIDLVGRKHILKRTDDKYT